MMQEIVERYIATWNETDPPARRKLVDELFATDATYTDPLAQLAGRDQIDAAIAAAQEQFAGLVFSLAAAVDSNHNQARFTWNLGPAGTEPLVVGFDVAVTDEAGQIKAVHGFLDKVPSA
jgi:hypothetical protein